MAANTNPNRVGIYMDVLENIILDLRSHPDLQRIFGAEVPHCLVVVADNNDLRIEEGGRKPLAPGEEHVFIRVLDEVIRANSV